MLNWIEKRMLNKICKKMGVKLTKDNLILSFHDLEGNGYYKFPKGIELPIMRMAKMQEYLMWMGKGASKEEYKEALQFAKSGLEGGIRDGKGLAKIGAILTELENRTELVIHDELFYNIIAVQLIRQDENISEFNHEIHLQKVEAFKELDKLNDTFFLNIQEYLEAFNLQNITKSQFENLMTASQQTRKAMSMWMDSLSEK